MIQEQKEIRELPVQEVIHEDDLFALDSDESNQTGKITYKQLLDKIRDDIFGEIQEAIDSGGDHDQDQDQQIAEMNAALRGVCNKVYPVGSVYISFGSEDPATIFGGEWERIEDRFLLAMGSTYTVVGDSGGYSEVTLTADQSGLRSHSHPFTRPTVTSSGTCATSSNGSHSHDMGGDIWSNGSGSKSAYTFSSNRVTKKRTTGAAGAHTHTVPNHTHTLSGGSIGTVTASSATKAHNNMPPYIVVNMWKRLTLATADATPIPEPEVEPDFERTFTEAQRSVIQGWNNVGSYSYSEALDLQVGNTVTFSNLTLTDMDAAELGTFDGEYGVVIGTNSSEETDTVEINERQYKLNIVSFGSGSISVGIIVSDYSDDAETVSTNIRLTGNYEAENNPLNELQPGELSYDDEKIYIKGDGTTNSWAVPATIGATYIYWSNSDILGFDDEGNSIHIYKTAISTNDLGNGTIIMEINPVLQSGYSVVITYANN